MWLSLVTSRRDCEHRNDCIASLDRLSVQQSYKGFYRTNNHRMLLFYTVEILTVHRWDSEDSTVQNVANSTAGVCSYRNSLVHLKNVRLRKVKQRARRQRILLHINPKGIEFQLLVVGDGMVSPPVLRRRIEVVRKDGLAYNRREKENRPCHFSRSHSSEFTVGPNIAYHVSVLGFIELNVPPFGPFDPDVGFLTVSEHFIVILL